MKLPGLIGVASLSVLSPGTVRADPTAPVDYTQRNSVFAPAPTIILDHKSPAVDDSVQSKRVDKTTVDKKPAAIGDRRAAIDVQETRDKTVREKDSHRPEAMEQPMSVFNRREAIIATANDTTKPALVTKYQDSLTNASAANMARFPALDGGMATKINRFVFRKNSPEPAPVTGGAPVVPAAGGSPVVK